MEDVAAFMICVVEGSFCPREYGSIFSIEDLQFFEEVLSDVLGHG